MTTISDILGSVFINGTFTALARIVDWSNNLLVQSAVSSIHYTIFDPDGNPVANHTNVSLSVSAAIYNTLQTLSIWSVDTTGFNFAWTINVETYPAFVAEGLYSVVFTIQPSSGQAIIVRFAMSAF